MCVCVCAESCKQWAQLWGMPALQSAVQKWVWPQQHPSLIELRRKAKPASCTKVRKQHGTHNSLAGNSSPGWQSGWDEGTLLAESTVLSVQWRTAKKALPKNSHLEFLTASLICSVCSSFLCGSLFLLINLLEPAQRRPPGQAEGWSSSTVRKDWENLAGSALGRGGSRVT